MVKTEFFKTRADGVNLYRTFSTEGQLIQQAETGIVYDEAVDVEGAVYTYEETGEAAPE